VTQHFSVDILKIILSRAELDAGKVITIQNLQQENYDLIIPGTQGP